MIPAVCMLISLSMSDTLSGDGAPPPEIRQNLDLELWIRERSRSVSMLPPNVRHGGLELLAGGVSAVLFVPPVDFEPRLVELGIPADGSPYPRGGYQLRDEDGTVVLWRESASEAGCHVDGRPVPLDRVAQIATRMARHDCEVPWRLQFHADDPIDLAARTLDMLLHAGHWKLLPGRRLLRARDRELRYEIEPARRRSSRAASPLPIGDVLIVMDRADRFDRLQGAWLTLEAAGIQRIALVVRGTGRRLQKIPLYVPQRVTREQPDDMEVVAIATPWSESRPASKRPRAAESSAGSIGR